MALEFNALYADSTTFNSIALGNWKVLFSDVKISILKPLNDVDSILGFLFEVARTDVKPVTRVFSYYVYTYTQDLPFLTTVTRLSYCRF